VAGACRRLVAPCGTISYAVCVCKTAKLSATLGRVDGHQRAKDVGQILFANLPFIHLVPGEMTAGADVIEALHQGVHFLCAPRLRCILLQPFPKSRIEGFVLGVGNKPRLLDEVCIGA